MITQTRLEKRCENFVSDLCGVCVMSDKNHESQNVVIHNMVFEAKARVKIRATASSAVCIFHVYLEVKWDDGRTLRGWQ